VLTLGASPLACDDKSEIRFKSVAVCLLIELSFIPAIVVASAIKGSSHPS
jgi:hypothetical protein